MSKEEPTNLMLGFYNKECTLRWAKLEKRSLKYKVQIPSGGYQNLYVE